MNIIDRAVYLIKKNSPTILVSFGVIGVVTGTIMACKETKYTDEILKNHEKQLTEIKMASDHGFLLNKETKKSVEYTDKDERKDIAFTYFSTSYKLVKLYLPSTLVIAGSIGCIIGSHVILEKRNIGLTAAYAGISQAFDEYRQKIVEKFGEQADLETRYGIKAKKKKSRDEENDAVIYESPNDINCSNHSRFFMADSIYWDKNKNMNLNNLFQAQQSLNRKLKTRRSHTISLNEIYDALDLDPAQDGQVLGYRWNPSIDPLDENGLPTKIKFAYWVFDDSKKKNVKKSIEEAIDEDGCGPEPVMLIDFPNLVPIV